MKDDQWIPNNKSMMSVIRLGLSLIILIAFFLIAFFSCGSSGGGDGGGNTLDTGIAGVVKNLEGNGVAGLSVSSGNVSTTTGSDGTYELPLTAGNGQIVAFSLGGYVSQSRSINIYSEVVSYQPIFMRAEEVSQTLDADSGGTVSGERNASLTVPPSAFVDFSGNPVTGSVEISLTPFDPSDATEVAAFPGDLRGETVDGEAVPLISYGIVDVSVRQNGEDLQVKTGETLQLMIPTINDAGNPETIDIWTFDAEDGIWHENDEDGTYDSSSNTYVAMISHLSPINTDRPFDPACVRGIVEDEEGNPISGARVTAQPASGINASVYSWTFTDEDGSYCMTVQRDLEALISVLTNDGSITRRTVQASPTRSISYPASCSQDSCQQLYTITVGTANLGPDTGTEANCSSGGEAFEGTCDGFGLDSFLRCFRPEGQCTSDLDFLNLDLEFSFENGSRLRSEIDSVTGSTATLYYGPTGTLCGTLSYSTDGITTTIQLPVGGTLQMASTETGATQITCPDGDTFLLSGSQQDAWRGCTGSTTSTVSGVPCNPAPGSFGYSCQSASDCDFSAGNECCGRFDDSKLCLPFMFCPLYNTSSCRTSDDCDALNVCCSAGYFSLCLPLNDCL